MRDKVQSGYELCFIIQEQHQGQPPNQAFMTLAVIETMIKNHLFDL